MKLTKIYLKNYLNFQEKLEIDLVYPKGHEDAGKPLKKVCILGQSATGKTTLLNLIKVFSFENDTDQFSVEQDLLFDENVGIEFLIEKNNYRFSKWSKNNKENIKKGEVMGLIYKNENNISSEQCKKFIDEALLNEDDKIKLISFPFDVIRSAFDFTKKGAKVDSHKEIMHKPEDDLIKKTESEQVERYLNQTVWDFSSDQIEWLWEIVLNQIKKYEPLYKAKAEEYFHKHITEEEFEKWEKENVNPLDEIAQKCINPILAKFNLKVKTDFDPFNNKHREFIPLQHINDDKKLSFRFSSTGTKQIIVTALPLCTLNADKAIILFDEPERSLYPDTQVGLIRAYTKLVPNSQFFFATHSPIVASAFEPWEVVELKFDRETGKVYRELYFEEAKQNHVKNYFVNPQKLNYRDIYLDIFDLVDDGNKDVRKPELEKLATLINKLDATPKKYKKNRVRQLNKIKKMASELKVDLRNYA